MQIKALVENTAISPEFKQKHGLSLYIETNKHKILFDLGSDALFLQNAEKLKVDITAVDTVVISHGHFDHGGALKLFLKQNKTAKVYVHKKAFDNYRTKVIGLSLSVGLDRSLKDHEQIILTEDTVIIDDEIRLFSNVSERICYPQANQALYVKTENGLQGDNFEHEQNLIITENGKSTLFAGCAHNGIINIMNKAEQLIGGEPDYAISGFHLYNPTSKKCESDDLVQDLANRLKVHKTKYYTCHCTGQKAYDVLKSCLKDQISYLSSGSCIEL